MDERDATSTPAQPSAKAPRVASAWDQFYAWCFAVIQQSPAIRQLPDADREDVAQEIMVEIVRKFGEDAPETAPEGLEGWIRVVSRNKAADVLRRRYRKPEVGFDDGAGAALQQREEDSTRDRQGEAVSLVWEALLRLDQTVPVTSYLVFYLRTIEGWSIQETAELFQISPEQVRARCHRVRKKFDAILKSPAPGAEARPDGRDE